jgi:chitinase
MSYDYYEADSDAITGHHAPLYANPDDPKHISADDSVNLYLKAGVPADKLVLGVPFYGHAWAEVGDVNHGLYQPGKKTDLEADYKLIVGTLLGKGFVRYWDSAASAPYLYNSTSHIFVSYDDPESMTLKCRYVIKHKLDGVMFWEYSGDANQALLDSINKGLERTPPGIHSLSTSQSYGKK